MKRLDKNDYYQEVFMGLTLTAFLGTLALFFSGLLIAQINSFNNSIRLPIVYLIICTVALVFSAIIYSNASGQTTSENWDSLFRHNSFANILSEFLGLNLFLFAIPMVINAVTNDNLIRLVVEVSVLLSLFLYSLSSFSILSRLYSKAASWVTMLVMTASVVFLLYAQIHMRDAFVVIGMSFFVVYLLWVVTLFFRDMKRIAP